MFEVMLKEEETRIHLPTNFSLVHVKIWFTSTIIKKITIN